MDDLYTPKPDGEPEPDEPDQPDGGEPEPDQD